MSDRPAPRAMQLTPPTPEVVDALAQHVRLATEERDEALASNRLLQEALGELVWQADHFYDLAYTEAGSDHWRAVRTQLKVKLDAARQALREANR